MASTLEGIPGLYSQQRPAVPEDNFLIKIGDVLQSTAAGMQGRPNPVLLRKQHEQQVRMEQERLNLQKQQVRFGKFEKMLEIGEKAGVPDDVLTRIFQTVVDTDDDLKEFKPIVSQPGFSVTGKKREISIAGRDFGDGELTDPLDPTKKLPKGKYDVTGTIRGGQFVPTKIAPAKPAETPYGKIDPKDYTPESLAAYDKSGKVTDLKPLPKATSKDVGNDREALAMELGYDSFAVAPKDIKTQINAEVKKREDQRIAQGDARLNQAETRLTRQEEQQRRLLPSQQKILTGNRTAMKAIDDYAQGYEEFVKESKGGPMSDIFRGAIARNTNAQRLSDMLPLEGRTPAEKKLAAKWNALYGNIRSLTDEVGVLTDVDAVRIMTSFNPAQDRSQVRANLAERKKSHQRAYDTALEDYQAIGKDVSGFMGTKGASANVQRSTSKSGKPIISDDGGKTWRYE